MTAKVELELEHAKTLARAIRYAEFVPGVATSVAHLALAIEAAEKEPDEGLLEEFRTGWREGRERARPRPRWDYVSRATGIIARMVRDDPAAIAKADALGAYVRDTFDALGLSLHDEETLYVAVTMAGLMVEMAENGREKGQVEPEVVEAVAKVAQSFTASILDFLPPEARG